jgi:hypothetical protein
MPEGVRYQLRLDSAGEGMKLGAGDGFLQLRRRRTAVPRPARKAITNRSS